MADQNQNVTIVAWPDKPVNMNMSVQTREVIPVCIKMCEPVCARSEYTISISIFDHPVASITVKGQTAFLNCKVEG
jgi:hypothetical protein